MAKPRKTKHSQMPPVIHAAEEDAEYMPLLSHLHCRQPWILSWWSPVLEHSFRVHIPDKSFWLTVSHVCALAARELKEGCSDARLSETTNVFLHLLMNIVIHSAVVNILMHCVSKIYESAGVYISHYDRCCQITFH